MPSLRTAGKWLRICAVNAVVCLALIGAGEFSARYYETRHQGVKPLPLRFFPYLMFISPFPSKGKWGNDYTDKPVSTAMYTNNLGFTADFDFTMTPTPEYLARHGKKPGEKIVLFTGGSAAAGFGATANGRSIGYRMQHYLNQAQQQYRYRVINMAMTSWISFQQFIALVLFGGPLDPDWIVVMDGSNDVAAACKISSGVGNPMFWPTMDYFLQGQSFRPDWQNGLLKRSALVRVVTGKQYVKPTGLGNYYYEPHEQIPVLRVKVPSKWPVIEDQLVFYMRAQHDVLQHFQNAKFIFSTQPTMRILFDELLFRDMADPQKKTASTQKMERRLKELYGQFKDSPCDDTARVSTHSYFLPKSAIELERMTADARQHQWREAYYVNPLPLFPASREDRRNYFVDVVHMNDTGQDMLGKFYAKKILKHDGFVTEADAL